MTSLYKKQQRLSSPLNKDLPYFLENPVILCSRSKSPLSCLLHSQSTCRSGDGRVHWKDFSSTLPTPWSIEQNAVTTRLPRKPHNPWLGKRVCWKVFIPRCMTLLKCHQPTLQWLFWMTHNHHPLRDKRSIMIRHELHLPRFRSKVTLPATVTHILITDGQNSCLESLLSSSSEKQIGTFSFIRFPLEVFSLKVVDNFMVLHTYTWISQAWHQARIFLPKQSDWRQWDMRNTLWRLRQCSPVLSTRRRVELRAEWLSVCRETCPCPCTWRSQNVTSSSTTTAETTVVNSYPVLKFFCTNGQQSCTSTQDVIRRDSQMMPITPDWKACQDRRISKKLALLATGDDWKC